MNKEPSQVVSGLVDGVEVLRCLAASPEPMTGVSLARKLGLSPVRVSRLLTTLSWMGIVHRDKSRRYAPGAGMHALATQNLAASGLLRRVIKHTEPLLEYPYPFAAGVLWRDQVTFLSYHEPNESALEGVRQWITPATVSSIGMALLAHRSDDEIHALYAGRDDIPGLYPTLDTLMPAIEQIRDIDYAALRWDTHTSLAVAIGQPVYTAIAVSGFQGERDEQFFLGELRRAAQAIEDDPDTALACGSGEESGEPRKSNSRAAKLTGGLPVEVYV